MNREQGVTWFWLKRGICSPEGTLKRSHGCVGVFAQTESAGFLAVRHEDRSHGHPSGSAFSGREGR